MKHTAKLALGLVVALAAGWVAGTFLPLPVGVVGLDPGRGHVPAVHVPDSPLLPGSQALPKPAVPLAASLPSSLSAFAAIPDVRQSTGYTCGVSALQAVLAYWGISEREDRLAVRLRSTPENGTHPLDILRVAREFGLTAELREGLALADLEASLGSGTTVIVDLQAWRERTDAPWTETWDDGHYMVLLAMDAEALYFEDPSLLGARGVIPRAEFVDRWHDYEGDAPLDPTDRKYVHMAIFLKGGKPPVASPSTVERVY
jgi:predicted double-glycine peptidase